MRGPLIAAALLVATLPSPQARAEGEYLRPLKGAEFRSLPPTAQTFYVMAVLDSAFSSEGSAENNIKQHVQTCLVGAGFTGTMFRKVVVEQMAKDPSSLTSSVVETVWTTVLSICGLLPNR